MGNEITALKDEIEISYLFSEPGRAALYITHPSWRLNKENIINEQVRQLLQQMKEYRNRIFYEGFMINENYIKLNKEKIQDIIKKLINLLR